MLTTRAQMFAGLAVGTDQIRAQIFAGLWLLLGLRRSVHTTLPNGSSLTTEKKGSSLWSYFFHKNNIWAL